MSFFDCISNAQLEGVLSPAEADRLRDRHRRNTAGQGGLGLDDAAAARATFDDFEAEVRDRRRQKLLAVRAQQQARFDMLGYRDELGRANLNDGARALMDSAAFASKTPGVQQIREAVRGKLHSSLAQAFRRFERDLAGNTRNKATLSETVDALFGSTQVSEAARQIAQAWRIAAERARLMFNDAGGHIGFREDWGLPQSHDWERIAAAGFEAWRDHVMPLLDRANMIDGRTGRPFSDAELELALANTFEAISTEGWYRRDASSIRPGEAVGNRRADHRFLIFKDGAGWRVYMERFGEGDAFKVMMDYLDGMARDIALMRRLGPNPAAGLEYVKQFVQRDAALTKNPAARDKARHAADEVETMYQHVTGAASIPSGKALASWTGELRQWLVSAQLGGAMLSALSDVGFQQITAAANGLPGWRVAARQLALLNPANHADREIAISLGLIADEAAQVMSAQQRHYGEAWGSKIAQRFADGVLRASGLSAWTQSGRWAFGMEFLGFMGRNSDQAFDALPKPLRATLQRYGFDALRWDAMRAGIADRGGARFVDPGSLDDDLAIKVLSMVRSETNFAVPSVSLYGRSKFAGLGRPGTIAGELTRSFMMYKNFGITLLFTHGRRAAMQTTWRGKIGYAGALIGTATVLGGFVLNLKEIAKGRDPRPMQGTDFMLAAMMQGGGFGIFGDFLFSDTNRFGGSWSETVAGPVAGFLFDVVGRGVIGNAQQALAREDMDAGADLVRLMERYTPGGSLWYARLTYQRMILDQLREAVDPDAGDHVKRLERRYRRDYGQDHWWRPGAMEPHRAPDLANAAAQPPE